MFDKFGEFDSYAEINLAAKGFLEEGDFESIKELAKENGIDEMDADDYIDGIVPELCNELMAAIGKIEIECKELQPKEIMEDWVEYIKVQCMDKRTMAAAVRTKGKNLKGCIAELLKWSFSNQIAIDENIKKAAGVSAGKVTLGIPGIRTAKKIIDKYYLGE